MPDRNDELLQIRNQSAQQAALRQIANQAQSEVDDYHRYIAEGDVDKAAWAQRGYQALAMEYNTLLASMGAARPQQPPQQQQQPGGPQLLPEDEEWIRNNQAVWNDPEKRAEIIKAANSLTVMHGLTGRYPRGSPQFYEAIEHWCGLKDASGGDALPIINDAEVARISKSKYGDVSADEIRQGKERVALLKQYGLYPMSQS
jgi:hypothetical protein